jgi:hypothetical protein
MNEAVLKEIELAMKEQRISYWEKNHTLPGCKEMTDYFDNLQTTI